MRALCLPLLLFGFALNQIASPQQNQVPSSPPPPRGQIDNSNVKPEDKATVEGKILNALTGEPLKKAHVTLRRTESTTVNAPPYGASTDAAGHFVIESVDPGRYHLSSDRNGFVRSDTGPKKLSAVPDTLTLSAGQKLSDLQLRLTPQSVIMGRVVDEDSEPVPNVRVQCFRYRYSNGKKTLVPVGAASTNDKGEYRTFGLAAGKYYVSATYSQNNFGPAEIRSYAVPEEGYVATYYPSSIDPGSAIQVNLAAGAETSSVDIRLLRAKTFQLTGRVTNQSKPSSQVQIMLTKHGDMNFGWDGPKRVTTDENGRFVLRGVVPGFYDLEAIEFNSEQQRAAISQVTVGDSNVEGLSLAFGVSPEIRGTLKIENIPEQPPQNGADLISYRISFYPDTSRVMSAVTGGDVREDGTFTFKNVMPLSYRLSVYPLQGDAYLKQIVSGEKEVADGRVDFSSGVDASEIKVVLSMNGSHIEGSVLDNKQQPSPHATVVLVPDRTDATVRYKSATTDQNGHYVLRGLAPGKYKLYAFDQIDAGALYDTDYMTTFSSKAETVEAAEGAKLTHDLQLIINDDMQ